MARAATTTSGDWTGGRSGPSGTAKRGASQRALLHGDDDDAADNIGWHHKALAMTRNAQSSTLLPTGSSWSGKLEPPPMLPQFIHGKPRRPMTTSPSKERPGSRG